MGAQLRKGPQSLRGERARAQGDSSRRAQGQSAPCTLKTEYGIFQKLPTHMAFMA
jgi:hypothetical protein